MRKIISKIFLLVAAFLLLPFQTRAAVVFSENFDSWPTGWTCTTDTPNPDFNYYACGDLAATCNGDTRPFAKGQGITASGFSGKGMQYPRSECDNTSYLGDMRLFMWNMGWRHKDLYFRWYAKIDEGFDKEIYNGFKWMDRIMIRTAAGASDELYPSIHGNTLLSNSNFMIYGGWPDGHFSEWTTIANNATFYQDHAWHAIELHIKINSVGVSDGTLECWIDGNKTAEFNNIRIKDDGGDYYFSEFSFGLGNTTEEEPFLQPTFKSLYYDEFVISTTYIGPLGGDTTPPASPSGLSVS